MRPGMGTVQLILTNKNEVQAWLDDDVDLNDTKFQELNEIVGRRALCSAL